MVNGGRWAVSVVSVSVCLPRGVLTELVRELAGRAERMVEQHA